MQQQQSSSQQSRQQQQQNQQQQQQQLFPGMMPQPYQHNNAPFHPFSVSKAPPTAAFSQSQFHMLSQYNGQAPVSTSGMGLQPVTAGISILPNITAHYQKQLEQAQKARLASSPHYHARQHMSSARIGLLGSSGQQPSASSLAQSANGGIEGDPLSVLTNASSSESSLFAAQANGSSSGSVSNANNTDGPAAGGSLGTLNDSRISVASNTSPAVSSTHHRFNDKEKQAQRPSQAEKSSGWSSLDLGGMLIHNISKALFRYTFLTHLYLNHNNLTSIPVEICNLRSLVHLNLSGNKLTSLPPELGLVISLRELLLFDNDLTFLPPEFGQLYQLDLLGIEGCPMDAPIMSLMQKDGTSGVITYLRDTCPIGSGPADREWIVLEGESYGASSMDTFTVMCYNTLCERYATPQTYAYTPAWALLWSYRKDLILHDILNYNADIVCLQEMEMGQYEDFFREQLSHHAEYESVFFPKSRARTMGEFERRQVDGCATFFKSSKFKLLEKHNVEFQQAATTHPELRQCEDSLNRVMVKDNIVVMTFLEHKHTGLQILVANAHLHWDPAYRDVKLVQAVLMLAEMDRLLSVWTKVHPATGVHQTPSILICGDLNSLPDSGVVEFLSRGHVPPDHDDIRNFKYRAFVGNGLSHKYSLKSAYSHIDELDFTNFTPSFRGVIDYVWYMTNTMAITGLLSNVDRDYVSKAVGFPDAHHPSDHIPLITSLRIKQPTVPNGPRKVNFGR